ncbi:hypothetical protein [Streptomyces sp. NPDC056056]|uniref:ATP-dependent DNA ligase n=1 Tax=Streptomyces sp. NPDC056056 TaxID=3345698 RepID=UPI0035DB4B77
MHPDMTLPFALPVPLATCRPVAHVPASGELALEPKLDGWRCQILAGSGRIWSRHATDLTSRFNDVAQASRSLPPCVLDGELVAALDDGTISFGSLQSRSPRGRRRGEASLFTSRPSTSWRSVRPISGLCGTRSGGTVSWSCSTLLLPPSAPFRLPTMWLWRMAGWARSVAWRAWS